MQAEASLSNRYNIPVPRYTSYPTVPSWKEGIDITSWKERFSRRFVAGNSADGISLYIHLPFCESLCIYCGCTKRITTNHSVEEAYIRAVLAEWEIYRALMPASPVIRAIRTTPAEKRTGAGQRHGHMQAGLRLVHIKYWPGVNRAS
jgi:oxygen-independent coproporphyrinogen-3 oxidase